MKLRIKHNSLRLRLTQTEVAGFKETGRVEEIIEFGSNPDQQFIYALISSTETLEIYAKLEKTGIIVFVPKVQTDEWISTQKVGVKTEQKISDKKTLSILIEKDFACLEPRQEDESDAFPHPLAGKLC